MLTKIDLCSMALLKLGEAPIQSLNGETAAARLARTLFDPTMDALLSMHPWRFACRNFDLARSADGDFQLPADVLRVIKCDGEICGNKILCPYDTVRVSATVRVAPEDFPGYFSSLAATRLAMEFCIPLTGDQTVFRMMTALYESELQTVKFIDSSASRTAGIDNFSLIDARY